MRILFAIFAVTFLVSCATEPEMMEHSMHMAPIESEEQFIVEMIPHHQEAVDTSQIILASTNNEQMKELTQRIITAQVQEISVMRGWLSDWYDGGYEASYMNMMPNLLEHEAVFRDMEYLEGMIMHHRMAVMMANQVLALEPREEVVEFARDVIEVQSAEIAEMQELLNTLKLVDSRSAE